jgi:transmembrane sensor
MTPIARSRPGWMKPDPDDGPEPGFDGASGQDSLFDEAVGLMLRLHENGRDPAARATLERWRRRSARHEQVWVEVQSIHRLAGQALSPPARPMGRRTMLRGAMGAGVLVLGGWTVLPPVMLAARADHRTGIAEVAQIALPDGGHVTLAPETALALDVEDHERSLRLLAGVIWCDIATPARPVSVQAGKARLQVASAAFELGCSPQGIAVDLARGSLDLTTAGQQTSLAAPDWLRLSRSGQMRRGRNPAGGEPAAWRNSRLLADAEPIASVIARIAPWLPGRIMLASQALGRQRISGVFDLTQPLSALRAAVWPHGGRVRQLGPLITVITTL